MSTKSLNCNDTIKMNINVQIVCLSLIWDLEGPCESLFPTSRNSRFPKSTLPSACIVLLYQ